jgi:hypothetical protein
MSILLSDRPAGLVARRRRLGDQVLARVLAARMDRDLAAGTAPESGLLLADRAQDLVAAGTREALARDWEHVLAVAAGPVPRTPVPVLLCRDRIRQAEAEVRAMAACLRAPAPVAARGVAAASVLLTDGAGPLYDKHHPTTLRDAARAVTAQLDPALSLF